MNIRLRQVAESGLLEFGYAQQAHQISPNEPKPVWRGLDPVFGRADARRSAGEPVFGRTNPKQHGNTIYELVVSLRLQPFPAFCISEAKKHSKNNV